MLKQLIEQVQNGQEEAAVALIKQFTPLLKKYAYKLDMEDAYEDLRCDFLELINTLDLKRFHDPNDKVLSTYFSKAVHSYYIKRLQKHMKKPKELTLSDLSEAQQAEMEARLSVTEDYQKLFLDDIRKLLTEKEFVVLTGIYLYGDSVFELSYQMKTSRQNINQIKKNALEKLMKKWGYKDNI